MPKSCNLRIRWLGCITSFDRPLTGIQFLAGLMMKTIFFAVALFLAYVQAAPYVYYRDGNQDVLEISKSNMLFKCQVSAVEDTPGKLASNC